MVTVIFLSALPLAIAWLWLKRRVNINAPYFLGSLAAGLLSLALAAVVQILLPAVKFGMTRGTRIGLLALACTALTEEGSRLVMFLFFWAGLRFFGRNKTQTADLAAAGMVAGLAFAAVETVSFTAYAQTSGLARLLRLSAVLLHATCGIRCALAASALLSKKISFLPDFARAVILHAVYNFIALYDGALYYMLGLLLTLSSFASGIRHIRQPRTGE
ncbi:MAG: hypothetical protein LBD86_02955 [Spirochaetaceae bacterium]|jgi:hypothetical protein|nr:hypothetical protein [Spirochaetaceae bacterium]